MVAMQVVAGRELREVIHTLLATPSVRYLHLHNAGPGCLNCVVSAA